MCETQLSVESLITMVLLFNYSYFFQGTEINISVVGFPFGSTNMIYFVPPIMIIDYKILFTLFQKVIGLYPGISISFHLVSSSKYCLEIEPFYVSIFRGLKLAIYTHSQKNVVRSYNEDKIKLQNSTQFHSFEGFILQPIKHNQRSNNTPIRPFGFLSPRQFLLNTVQYV